MTNEIRKALVEERRRRFLEALISEAVINVLAEQEQPAPAPAPAPALAPETPATSPSSANEPNPGSLPGAQPFTVDSMIERLNVIRGGRSFTDPEVYGRLVTYFKTLDDDSKAKLESFLVELGKIVIDVGQEAPKEPQDKAPAAEPAPAPPAPPPQAAAPPANAAGTAPVAPV